jgi:hypothetical protein
MKMRQFAGQSIFFHFAVKAALLEKQPADFFQKRIVSETNSRFTTPRMERQPRNNRPIREIWRRELVSIGIGGQFI